MKRQTALLALTLLVCVQNAPGQGYVYFSNKYPPPCPPGWNCQVANVADAFDAPVFGVDGTTRIMGVEYIADLAVQGPNGWVFQGFNVAFYPKSGPGTIEFEYFAGYFDGSLREVKLPNQTLASGDTFTAMVVVWDSTLPIGPGIDYDDHRVYGASQPFQVWLGGRGDPADSPGRLSGLQSFSLVAPWNNAPAAVAGVQTTTGSGQVQLTTANKVTIEATGQKGTLVTFDGSQSHDPDGDPLLFAWDDGGLSGLAGPDPTWLAFLGLGSYTFTLTVTDPYGGSDADDITIEIVDTTLPDTIIYGARDSFGNAVSNGGSTPSSSLDVEVGGFDNAGIAYYLYSVDGQPPLSAPGPIIPVTVSTSCGHVIEVWAVDIAGSADPSPAVFAWEFRKPASPLSCVPPPPNLVAWWSFDETSGTISADIIGQNNGTQSNGPTPACGMVEGGLAFDGSNDFVFVPNTPSLNFGTGDFTIDCWLRTSQKTAPILDKRATIQGRYVGYQFMVYTGGLLLQMADGGMGSGWRNFFYIPNPGNGKPDVSDGQWHFVALTVTRGQVGTFYVDGVAVHTFNPSAISGSLDNTAPLFIGRASPGLSNWQPFYGTLDELELFNRALIGAEILDIYTAGPDGKCK